MFGKECTSGLLALTYTTTSRYIWWECQTVGIEVTELNIRCMNTEIKEIEDNLNDIIQKNEDAIKGYEKASENAKEIGLQSYFRNKAKERRNFLVELKTAVPSLQTRDKVDGSAAGSMHRTWMDIKAFFSSDNDEAMLEEAIRGDKAAVEEYDEVLADGQLPMEASNVIRQQRDWIREDLEKIKTMEDIR